jgi:UDP-N-acetylmuramoyl-tripeptide--D-alanyl-D-alanine ligase
MGFESKWIGNALSTTPRFDRDYASITSDSRKAGPGAVFIALPGEKFDGHDFILSAIESGSEAIIAANDRIPPSLPAHIEVFAVPNTLDAYRKLAAEWRASFDIPFVCVAGSVGKTTTKELLSSILRGRFHEVRSTEGSQNGFVGIPMTLLSLPRTTDVAVIEVGIDEPGTMIQHIDLVRPTHSLLTAIGPEHLEKLIDLPTVAKEEGIALQVPAERGATIVVRLDDEWIERISETLPLQAHIWTCQLRADSETESDSGKKALLDTNIRGEYHPERETLRVVLPNGSSFDLPLPLPGKHNAGNLLTAATVACSLGLSPIEIQRGLAGFRNAFGRSDLKLLPGPTPALCDYYNANPSSVEAALDTLADIATKHGSRRKLAVLGDMLELGPEEESFHRALAKKIESIGTDAVFLYGERMKWLQDELKTSAPALHVEHFPSHEALANSLHAWVKAKDAILVKGSRGMRMEKAWDEASKRIESDLLAEATVTGNPA